MENPQDSFYWRVFNLNIYCGMLESVLSCGICHWNLEPSLVPNSNASSETFESSSLSPSLILDIKFLRIVSMGAFLIHPNSRWRSTAHSVLSFLCLFFNIQAPSLSCSCVKRGGEIQPTGK